MQIFIDGLLIPCEDSPDMQPAFNRSATGHTIGPMADGWVTVREAMDLLGISRSRVYALKNNGEIGWQRSGGILKLAAADVREYAAREKKPGWPRGQSRKTGG